VSSNARRTKPKSRIVRTVTAPPPQTVRFVRAEDLAARWSVHKSTITRLRQAGILTGNMVGRLYLYDPETAEAELRCYFKTEIRQQRT
jgi:hypothetical protein